MDGRIKITASIAVLLLCAGAFAAVAYAAYSGTSGNIGTDAQDDTISGYVKVNTASTFSFGDSITFEFNTVWNNAAKRYDYTFANGTGVQDFKLGSIVILAGEEKINTGELEITGTQADESGFITFAYKLCAQDDKTKTAQTTFGDLAAGETLTLDVYVTATFNANYVNDQNVDNLQIPGVSLTVRATALS